MKKIPAFLLIAVILLCLGSCGDGETAENSASTTAELPATLEEKLTPEGDDLGWGDFEVVE